jgi:hypothetical protein
MGVIRLRAFKLTTPVPIHKRPANAFCRRSSPVVGELALASMEFGPMANVL